MTREEFRKRLVGLKEGDIVTFVFKRHLDWATYFLALFSVKPHIFEYIEEFPLNWKIINQFMIGSARPSTQFSVRCKVMHSWEAAQLNLDWMLEFLYPVMVDFTVSGPK